MNPYDRGYYDGYNGYPFNPSAYLYEYSRGYYQGVMDAQDDSYFDEDDYRMGQNSLSDY